jgi:hypothetical protein
MWPFNRKPETAPPLIDKRGWNEDWQVGDIAECINDNWDFASPQDPKVGDVLTVSGLRGDEKTKKGVVISALKFEGKCQYDSWHCKGFIKHRGISAMIETSAKRAKQRENA